MKVLTCLVCMIALVMTMIAGYIFFAPDPHAANGGAGNPGFQGEQGDKGDPGVGIVKVEIVNGEFIITYTDGNVVNLGPLVVEQGTPGLEYYPLPNGTLGVMPGTTLYMEEIVIPATYNGWAVTEIMPESFSGSTNLKQIHLSDSVTSIGDSAFYRCTGLTSVVIPDSVTRIGKYAFFGCSKLTDIYFTGSEDEWNAITKDIRWDTFTGSYTVHYNYVPD